MQSLAVYQSLLEQITRLTNIGRPDRNTLLQTYWQVGRYIIMMEQNGDKKALYGKALLDNIAKKLTATFGKGFSRSNLSYMRRFFLHFSIRETLQQQLTWSHYFQVLKAENELEINFYTTLATTENWSVRQLKRNMNNKLIHHTRITRIQELCPNPSHQQFSIRETPPPPA